MLEKLVIIPYFVPMLAVSPSNLPIPDFIQHQHQNPPIYAQASEDLSVRLLREADRIYFQNPKRPYAAIPIYKRVIAEGGFQREEAIERLGNLFYNLVFNTPYNELNIKSALDFYNEVIQRYPDSGYLIKAYRYSGLILTTFHLKEVREGIKRMKEAYQLANLSGDLETKFIVAWHIGRIGFEYLEVNEKEVSLEDVKFYLSQVKELKPISPHAKAAETLLKKLNLKFKTK